MAIVIPSKHIYSKSFDPVVDNNIDKVEVSANEIVPDNHYDEPVYNKETALNTTTETFENQDNIDFMALNAGGSTTRYGILIGGLYCFATYHNISELTIPKVSNNHKITDIAKTDNGVADIKYNINFDVDYYQNATSYVPSTGNIDLSYASGQIIGEKKNVLSFSTTEINYTQNATDISNNLSATTSVYAYLATNTIEYIEENNSIKIRVYAKANSNNNWVPAMPTIDISKFIPIMSVGETSNNEEYYIIKNIKILSGIDARIMSDLRDFTSQISNVTGNVPIRGLRVNTIPQGTISITLYGNTVGIDLQDKTVTIGDGNKVFSFDGNELIQTTNTPSAESKYQGVIDKWKNGKQTAVISCPIADYYDENGEIKISQKPKFEILGNTVVAFKGNPDTSTLYNILPHSVTISFGTLTRTFKYVYMPLKVKPPSIDYEDEIDFEYFATDGEQLVAMDDSFDINGTSAILYPITLTEDFTTNNQQLQQWFVENAISNKAYYKPMTFHIGDIVEPYTYTNKGDKPLSRNKDLTPKQFKVVGTKISKKQGGTQELTLQED